MASQDHQIIIDQNRIGEAEFLDRGGELRQLTLGMGAGVARIGCERTDREALDLGMGGRRSVQQSRASAQTV